MKRKVLAVLLVMGLCVGTASAQFGFGIVYDPTNYANAILRYSQLVQQLAQLQQTYTQIVQQYNLAVQMAKSIQNMPARYEAQFSQWRNVVAPDAYGNTGTWVSGMNTGLSRQRQHRLSASHHSTVAIQQSVPRRHDARRTQSRAISVCLG